MMNLSLQKRVKEYDIEYLGSTMKVVMQSVEQTEIENLVADIQTKLMRLQRSIKDDLKDGEELTESQEIEIGRALVKAEIDGKLERLNLHIVSWELESDGKVLPIDKNTLELLHDQHPELVNMLREKAKEVQSAHEEKREDEAKNFQSGQAGKQEG